MTLGESELQRIGDYVRGHLYTWLNDVAPQVIVGPQLLQRMLRLEEELKNLRQTMETRFAAQQAVMEGRFAAIDERFESQQATLEARFAAIDKRFVAQQDMIEARFAANDKKLEAQQAVMKAGFDAVNKRFETIDKRFDSQHAVIKAQQWIVIVGFVILGTLVSVLGIAA